jgi:hypothetical protein
MEELRENLNLPGINGELVAYYRNTFNKTTRNLEYTFGWEVYILLHGPDRRYDPAVISISGAELHKFLVSLQEASIRMKALDGHSFQGTYLSEISTGTPGVVVKGENGRICGGPIELDTKLMVQREPIRLAEFESATKRSQTQPGSNSPGTNEYVWSCTHLG